MPITVEYLKRSGRLKELPGFYGMWTVEPPLQVIARQDSTDQVIKNGKVYEVSLFDEKGKCPGCVHLNPTALYWWNMNIFDPCKN